MGVVGGVPWEKANNNMTIVSFGLRTCMGSPGMHREVIGVGNYVCMVWGHAGKTMSTTAIFIVHYESRFSTL